MWIPGENRRVKDNTSDTGSVVWISCCLVNPAQKGRLSWEDFPICFFKWYKQNNRAHTVASEPHTAHQPNAGKPWHRVVSLSTPLNISSGNQPWSAALTSLLSFSSDVKQETRRGSLWCNQSLWLPVGPIVPFSAVSCIHRFHLRPQLRLFDYSAHFDAVHCDSPSLYH